MISHHSWRATAVVVAAALAAAVLPPPSAAFASSPVKGAQAAGEKTKHYEAAPPATRQEALALLETGMSKIDEALAAADTGALHAATYGVEAAIARLSSDKGYDGLTVTVAPRLEIVHLASELGDIDTLKAAVPALKKALKDSLVPPN